MNEKLVGSATSTYDWNKSQVVMSVSNNNDMAIRQTRQYIIYEPGKSLDLLMTGVINYASNGINTISRLGYFDANDGIFFEYSNGKYYIVERWSTSGSVVNTKILKSDWNCDIADGTGSSNINIDFTKTHIYFIKLQWLGVGIVQTGIIFCGKPLLLHTFYHSNVFINAYMKTANLPIRYEISSINTTWNTGSINQICLSAIIEGSNINWLYFLYWVNNNTGRFINTWNETPILSIKLNNTTNHCGIVLNNVSINNLSNTTNLVRIYFIQAPETTPLTGAWFNAANTNSFINYDTSATAFTVPWNTNIIYTCYMSSANPIFWY